MLDIESGHQIPPNFRRDIQLAAFLPLKNLLFPSRRRSYWERVSAPYRMDYTYLDRHANAWLDSVYVEFDKVERSSVALCGEGDVEVSAYRQQAPRGLRFNRGIVNTKKGALVNLARKYAISDEE
jgi:hypothetical protein